MKLVRTRVDEYYHYEGDSLIEIVIEETKQYHYCDEKEKMEHSRYMQELGYEDSGWRKADIGTLTNPIMVWCGTYYKHNTLKQTREIDI